MPGYEQSRMNALRWGIAVSGPIRCTEHCPYRSYYVGDECMGGHPPVGDPCPHEQEYAALYGDSMRRSFPLLVEHRPTEFADLVAEAVDAALVRERARVRSNRAWDIQTDERWHEFELAERYWISAMRRYDRVLTSISGLCDEVNAELEDKYWRTRALSSCIGSRDIPEPYRSWAVGVVQALRRRQLDGNPAT